MASCFADACAESSWRLPFMCLCEKAARLSTCDLAELFLLFFPNCQHHPNSRPELSQIFNIPANVCKYFPFQGLWHQNVCFPIWPVLHSLLKLRDRIRLTNCLFVSSRLYSYQMLLLSKGRFTFVFLSWKCLYRQTQRNGVSTFAA